MKFKITRRTFFKINHKFYKLFIFKIYDIIIANTLLIRILINNKK